MMQSDPFSYGDNKVDSTARIGANVTLGKGNIIGEYAVIKGRVIIGDNNYIAPHTVIGEPGEYRTPPTNATKDPKIIIGNGNRISEFVAIQSSVLTIATQIGDNNMIMHGCHVAHDCVIGNDVNIAPLASLGGMVKIFDYANLGQGVIIHPRKMIGKGAMIGMNSTVTKDIPDWELWMGCPAKYIRQNDKAIEKWK